LSNNEIGVCSAVNSPENILRELCLKRFSLEVNWSSMCEITPFVAKSSSNLTLCASLLFSSIILLTVLGCTRSSGK
jgi:hypothetical protein